VYASCLTPAPAAVGFLLVFVPVVHWIILIVRFVTDGNAGSNNFGPDPKGGSGQDTDDDGAGRSALPAVRRQINLTTLPLGLGSVTVWDQ